MERDLVETHVQVGGRSLSLLHPPDAANVSVLETVLRTLVGGHGSVVLADTGRPAAGPLPLVGGSGSWKVDRLPGDRDRPGSRSTDSARGRLTGDGRRRMGPRLNLRLAGALVAILQSSEQLSGWRSTQSLRDDGAVDSEQRVRLAAAVVDPTLEGARRLGDTYWSTVESLTLGLVRARRRDGGGVALRGLGRDLLRFAAPLAEVTADETRCSFGIVGGVLARRPEGSITFVQTHGDEPELRSTISGFHPRLAARPGGPRWTGVLYSLVQRRLHLTVSRRYFRRLLDEGER